MKDFIIKKTIKIAIEPSKVWDALTNPEKTKKYFFRCKVFSEWKVGSPIVFKRKLFLIFPMELKGEILQIDPGNLLKYSLKNGSNNSSGFSIVTDELTYANGETTLSITDDVGGEKGAAKRFKRSDKGWDKILKGLKKLLKEDH